MKEGYPAAERGGELGTQAYFVGVNRFRIKIKARIGKTKIVQLIKTWRTEGMAVEQFQVIPFGKLSG